MLCCSANLGPKTYLIFAGWMLFSCISMYFWLPETKGRSPAELDAMFEARVPARQFKSTSKISARARDLSKGE